MKTTILILLYLILFLILIALVAFHYFTLRLCDILTEATKTFIYETLTGQKEE